MTSTDPLLLRCLSLTGSFETGKLAPACFSVIAGDFDGQGISFSALQWNFGQGTLQRLLSQMLTNYPLVMNSCFGSYLISIETILPTLKSSQLAWARSIQETNYEVLPRWVAMFAALGTTFEWQTVAQESAQHYFEQALVQAQQLKLSSDRAMALLFDCAVQNGGVSVLALNHVLDVVQPGSSEVLIMRAVAEAVADGAFPQYRQDVLTRKLTIANGVGTVHGLAYNLADFGL